MVEEVVWPHFWAVQLWMSVLMLQFCTLREFARFLGGQKNARPVLWAAVRRRGLSWEKGL
jgi:hypothetical protein